MEVERLPTNMFGALLGGVARRIEGSGALGGFGQGDLVLAMCFNRGCARCWNSYDGQVGAPWVPPLCGPARVANSR